MDMNEQIVVNRQLIRTRKCWYYDRYDAQVFLVNTVLGIKTASAKRLSIGN